MAVPIVYSYRILTLLNNLQWLVVHQDIDFKALLIVYKTLHSHFPSYLSDLFVPYILQ